MVFHFKKAFAILRDRSGIAIITAILALSFMVYLATEVTYDATVEYVVNSQELKRLKAYYAARAGVEVSLLRIKTYQQVTQRLGKNAASYPMINMIWQFPFQFPLAIPEGMGMMAKDDFKEANEESFFDAQFDTQISDEGSKIDLNDLVSPSKILRENARRLLLNTFTQELEGNKIFQARYRNFRFEELVNQMADFMSQTRSSLNGGDKAAAYSGDYQGYPPNRAFRTISELRVLPLMEEDIFNLIQNRVTVFGLKGINPNTANKEVLMSLDPGITSEVADRLIKRRENQNEGGPYRSADDFWSTVNNLGVRMQTDPQTIPIVTDSLVSFRIKVTGIYGNVRSQVEAIVSDIDKVANRVTEYVKKENPPMPGSPNPNPNPNPANPAAPPNQPIPAGPPRILYWVEY